ncbi:hypothetical protein HHK36_022034 [Tetracentron sinense]|uniref:PGG domain-containing protein n=1 Tax=Tetracentron sinense TaxID=13715 RepID=A0A834YRD8_TETSI|nr:hypothetical protein HHK36_022034 [Tetracentron sinense]
MDPRLYEAATWTKVYFMKERIDRLKERIDRSTKEREDLIEENTDWDDLTVENTDLIKEYENLIKERTDLIKEHAHLIKKLKEENPNLLLGVTSILENTVLHLAAKLGREDLVKEVCEQCESLLAMTNSKGNTALHIAARDGHLSIVKFLVDKSISVSTSIDVENQTNNILRIQNEGKNTVLHEALRYRHSEVAKVLADKDPELWRVANEAGESPLYLAVKGGLTEIVRQVLKSSHPYAHGGTNRLTALHATIIWGHYGIAKLLVEKKPGLIIEQDIYGRTALHYAASYDRKGKARLLLESDTTVAYIQDEDGRSPLHYAAGNGNVSITMDIIRSYPDAVELVDKRGQNAIHFCIANYNQCMPWGHEAVLRWFMSSKVKHDEVINQADHDGNTPLHLAIKRGSPDLVRLLLKDEYEGRLDTDAMNKAHLTPLDLALPREHPQSKEVYQVYSGLKSARANRGISKPLDEAEICLDDTVRKAEDYMRPFIKKMNNHQMLVAALIATVTFAAALQVPGGYKSEGTATLAREATFKAFVITDAIALACSMTAVFLNFVILLPHRWPIELIHLLTYLTIIAMVAMLIAFVAGLYVVVTNSLLVVIFTCLVVFGICFSFFVFCLKFDYPVSDAHDSNNSSNV